MFSAVLFTLVNIFISHNVQLGFSLTVSCVDSKCEGVISEAYALDDYHSRNKEVLSFDKDQKIDVLAKGTGVHGDKWFGRDVSSGEVGYVYSAYLSEVPSSRSSSVISVDVKTLGPQYQTFADDLNLDEGDESLDEGEEDVINKEPSLTTDDEQLKSEDASNLPDKENREHESDDAKKLPEEELAADKIMTVTNTLADNISELAPDALEANEHAPDIVETSELARDTVKSSELAANTAESSELAANTVKSSELAANTVESSELAADTVKFNEHTPDTVGASEHIPDTLEASKLAPDMADVPQTGDHNEQSTLNHAGNLDLDGNDHSFHASDDFHFHDHHGDLGNHEHGDHDFHSHDHSHGHHSHDSHSNQDHNYNGNHDHTHDHGEHHHSHNHVDYGDFNHIEREDWSESVNFETKESEKSDDTAANSNVETDESLIKPVTDDLKDDSMSVGREDVVKSESGDKIIVIEGSEGLESSDGVHGSHVVEQTVPSTDSSTESMRTEQGQSSAVSLLVSVVGHLDVMLHNAVDRLPPSVHTVLRREPLGLSPEMSLLSLVMAVTSFLVACAMSCDRSSANSRRKTRDELLSLQQRLQQAISAKVALEDKVAKAEKQVVNVQQREGSAHESNSKMEKEIRDLKEKEKAKTKEAEQYKATVHQLTDTVNQYTQEAQLKEAENKQLKADLANTSERVLQLEQSIAAMQTSYTAMQSALAEAQAQAQTMTEEVTVLQQNHDKLALQEVTWKDKAQQLIEQVSELLAEQATHTEQLQVKQQEVKALQDYCVQMEVYYRQQPSAKATDDDVADKTADVDSQSRISTLLDTAKMSAHIKQLEKEKEEVDSKLKIESESRRDLEEQVAHLQYEMENFRDKYHQAQQQSSEASLRLNVLSDYFKQKELEMQKELGEQQARHKDSSSMLSSVGEKARFTEQQLTLYQQQVEDVRKEMQKQEQDYHRLVAAQEKKAHENWLAARKAEREVKEAKSECALLRQRLVDAERRLEQEKTENELLQSSASGSVLNGAAPGGLPFPLPLFPAPPPLPRRMSPLARGELPPPPFMPFFRPPLPQPHFGPGDDEHYGGRHNRDWRPNSGSVSPGMQGYADRQLSPRDRQPSLPSTARSSPPLMIDRHSPSLDGVDTSGPSGGRDYSPPPPRDRRVPPSGAQFPPDRSQWAPQPAYRPPFAPDLRPPPPPNTFGFRSLAGPRTSSPRYPYDSTGH